MTGFCPIVTMPQLNITNKSFRVSSVAFIILELVKSHGPAMDFFVCVQVGGSCMLMILDKGGKATD